MNHQEADRVPVDLGGSILTSMHVSIVYKLRQALGLDPPGTPVKVVEAFQMLGEVKTDLLDALGSDVVSPPMSHTLFGFPCTDWKEWTTFDGTPVLVPGLFNTDPNPDGSIYQYPQGDKSCAPSGLMPEGGWYIDFLPRTKPVDDSELRLEDNLEEFGIVSEAGWKAATALYRDLYEQTDRAVMGGVPCSGFFETACISGPSMKNPKGIRDIPQIYMSLLERPDFLYKMYEGQCEIAMANLKNMVEAVGDYIQIANISGSDFATQVGPVMAPQQFRDLVKPFFKQINDYIHAHTTWKTWFHCCGAVMDLLPDFIDCGFDCFNPVQCSANNMDPGELKKKFGDRITLWGGGVDTQKTLPFGTPDDVRKEVHDRIRIFGPGGGFVFNTVHNIQGGTPIENVLAMIETLEEYRDYPLR